MCTDPTVMIATRKKEMIVRLWTVVTTAARLIAPVAVMLAQGRWWCEEREARRTQEYIRCDRHIYIFIYIVLLSNCTQICNPAGKGWHQRLLQVLLSQNSFEGSAGKEYISGNATNTLSPNQVLLYYMCCVPLRVLQQGALLGPHHSSRGRGGASNSECHHSAESTNTLEAQDWNAHRPLWVAHGRWKDGRLQVQREFTTSCTRRAPGARIVTLIFMTSVIGIIFGIIPVAKSILLFPYQCRTWMQIGLFSFIVVRLYWSMIDICVSNGALLSVRRFIFIIHIRKAQDGTYSPNINNHIETIAELQWTSRYYFHTKPTRSASKTFVGDSLCIQARMATCVKQWGLE